jgi:orotate phosphoribosyltransferase-like protein
VYTEKERNDYVNKATSLVDAGMSGMAAARELGINYVTLRRWAISRGVVWSTHETEQKVDREKMMSMREQGFSYAAIGREFGVSRERIRQLCARDDDTE